MKRLDLTVFEPGDTITTSTATGDLKFWIVKEDGLLLQPDYGPLADPPRAPVNSETSLDALNLTVRTYNLLKREGIETYGGLGKWWREQVTGGRITPDEGASEIRNFGTSSVHEVRDLLAFGPVKRPEDWVGKERP
jgi:hypothetical protein